jgi:hypothetical protein
MVIALAMLASSVSAQDSRRTSFASDLVKQVFLDPTTYAPTILAWEATRLDWQSSQVFFKHGWLESNPRFTISGRSEDTAIGYAAGNRQILRDSLSNLQLSLANNLSERITERLLVPRYPAHRKLIRAIGWIERGAIASYLSYQLSAGHFRQWQANETRAQQLGL